MPPNPLTDFAAYNPTQDWEAFRQYNESVDYNAAKNLMVLDQGGLCAYCEKKIGDLSKNLERVEHFHPKSDTTDPAKNWALDWNNVFAVCLGGSHRSDADHTKHPLPANLSCDAYKDHLISKNKLQQNCEGYLLNPLAIYTTACLFDLDKATGELKPNRDACESFKYEGENQYANFVVLVEKTIELLNLNCRRLCDERLEVLKQYNQQITKARKAQNKHIFFQLAQRWFSTPWPSFFTTRRIIMEQYAENYLLSVNYNG